MPLPPDIQDKFKDKNLAKMWAAFKATEFKKLKQEDASAAKLLEKKFDQGLASLFRDWDAETKKWPAYSTVKLSRITANIEAAMSKYETEAANVDAVLGITFSGIFEGFRGELGRRSAWYLNPQL